MFEFGLSRLSGFNDLGLKALIQDLRRRINLLDPGSLFFVLFIVHYQLLIIIQNAARRIIFGINIL